MTNIKRLVALMLIAVMLFASIPFSVSAANDYWGFNDYVTTYNGSPVNPGAPEEITSWPTTVKRTTVDGRDGYTFTSTMSGVGTVTIKMQKRPWGTYNLWSWTLTTSNGTTHSIAGGATDFEYVHQTVTHNGYTSYTGGNHGNEALVSINLYNAETGEEIKLSSGQSTTVNAVHIIEKTKLLRINDANSDSIGDYDGSTVTAYTENDVYADATRKYTITGPQVKLNVDYKFVRDTVQRRSYNGMLPISKVFGRYCDLYDKDGNFLRTVHTRDSGDTSSANFTNMNTHNRGNYATRAVIYGDDYSQYQFDVRVNTYTDSLNEHKDGNYRTAYWDMTSTHNKLYFTKYDDSMPHTQEEGTEYHTEVIWLFKYDANGRTPTPEVPITYGNKDYTITNTNAPVTGDGGVSYAADLTDSVATDSFGYTDNSWFAIWKGHNTNSSNVASITIPLNGSYDLNRIRLHLHNYGSYYPKSITAYASSDGVNYSSIGKFHNELYNEWGGSNTDNISYYEVIQTESEASYWAMLECTSTAAYVRIDIELNEASDCYCMFINELEVYGTAAPERDTEAEDDSVNNIARKKNYKISITDTPISNKNYGTSYGAKLTDGIALTTVNGNDDSWFAFQKTWEGSNTDENGIGTVTIDLGDVYDISELRLHLANAVTYYGVYAPERITAYYSNVGDESPTLIGDFEIKKSDEDKDTVYWTNLEVSDVKASTIIIEFEINKTNGYFAFVNEIEAYGTLNEDEADPDPDEDIIYGDVNMSYNGSNAGSAVNISDCILIKRNILKTYEFNDDQFLRGDINEDGKINISDYILCKRIVLKTFSK